jgi:uncharacterized repeat protein (TIGR01451 family)
MSLLRAILVAIFVVVASLAVVQPSAGAPGDGGELPEGVDPSWFARVQVGIRDGEYRFQLGPASYRPGRGEVFQAPNRALDMRLYFDDEGVEILERSRDGAPTIMRLALAGWGRAGAMDESPAGALREVDGRMERLRRGLTEGYANSPAGLELSWEIGAPTAGDGPLVLELVLEHASARTRGGGVEIVSAGGRRLLLQAPRAADRDGNDLAARLVVAERGRLQLAIDDATALYPLHVKTLLNGSADTLIECYQNEARWGWSVSTAGDVNGDGYADVIVGSPYLGNGALEEGSAWVFLGSAAGIVGSSLADAQAHLRSNQPDSKFGYAVSTAGDVNGDGYSDVIVGASMYGHGHMEEGAALIFLGSAAGIVGSSPADAHALIESDQESARLGESVSTAGDVNGDGYADVIIGAYAYDNGQQTEGAALVFLGSAAGIVGSSPADAHALLESDQANAQLGHSVSTAGDVNGDGFADVIVGARDYDNGEPDEGAALVFLGSAGGIVGSSPADAYAVLESEQEAAHLGESVSTAGDVNGDGFADVIVSAYRYDNGETNEGAALVFLGSADGIVGSSPADAFALLESDQAFSDLGSSVSTAGDVNGDGFADVIVGVPYYNIGQTDEGAALVFLGSAAGIVGSSPADAFAVIESDQEDARLGLSVSTTGDVNGDGYADVIVGVPYYNNFFGDAGAVLVFLGSALGIVGSSPADAHAPLESDQAGAQLGYSVSTAGDVNGDGYADVIVGAPYYDHGQIDEGAALIFLGSAAGVMGSSPADAHALLESDQQYAYLGASVSTAGDVNGDGYADVIVGARSYDNGQSNEGAALVFLGSTDGIVGSSPADAHALLESNQDSADLGSSVSTAGDINGDGFADVIIGARSYDNGQSNEGAALVFLGSAAGIVGSSPAGAHALLESDQQLAYLGHSVSTAGDVNGDGFADVIVGASTYDNGQPNEGAALVFLGSAAGIEGSGPADAHALLESDQADAQLGVSVSTAGDVNGDGFAEVIVGAGYFDNGQPNEGAALVFLGSAAGIMGSSPADAHALIEANQASARLGSSVSVTGDVNGDGFADVIVGAGYFDNGQSDEGAALVFLGSAAGIVGSSPADAHALLEANQASARLGSSVSAAGDVNGDGFADVIVGAVYFDNGDSDEGVALVLLGNSEGRPVQAQQLAGPGDHPIQPWGLSGLEDGFAVRMGAASPRGRELVKLELEACPRGVGFGSPACSTLLSQEWVDTTASAGGVEMEAVVAGLEPGELYRWRVRTLYLPFGADQAGVSPPPVPPHGPWRRLGAQAEEADIRVSGVPRTADLHITKDDGQTTAIPGLPLTYTIVAGNPGPSDVPGATVADSFPAELLGVSWTCVAAGGASCTASGAGDIADTVDLPVGGSVTYTATGTLDPAASGSLVNTATIQCPGGVIELDPDDNTATDTDTVADDLFVDGFESGDTTAWSATIP